jgi:DNA-binding protein HU-beta
MASKPATAKAKQAAIPARSAKKSTQSASSGTLGKTRAQASTIAVQQKKAAETVSLKGVFEELAARFDLQKKQAHLMLDEMVERLTAHLKNGVRIRMNGLGILEVKDRPARQGRNPATGETIEIAASKKVAFRPAKELKEAV